MIGSESGSLIMLLKGHIQVFQSAVMHCGIEVWILIDGFAVKLSMCVYMCVHMRECVCVHV